MNSLAPTPAPGAAITFLKGHGTGNDFVLLPDEQGELDITAELVQQICDRHHGLGADGLIRLVRTENLGDPEGQALGEGTEWFMDYRNADGSVSQMCGNGVRVFVQALLHLGWVELAEGAEIPVGTRGGIKRVRRSESGFAVSMGPASIVEPELADTTGSDAVVGVYGLEGVPRPGLSVSMGNPHTVVALASVEELDEADLHRAPIVEPEPGEGTNVELVVPAVPLVEQGIARISMRVHERGVGETQSCGTGACAAAAAVRFWSGHQQLRVWSVSVPGGDVQVSFLDQDVELSGPAEIVASGEYLS